MSANDLPEGPWCGHMMVDLKTWLCADCDTPLPPAARRRLEQSPTQAPDGYMWILQEGKQEDCLDGFPHGDIVGIFSDRKKIIPVLVRGFGMSAESIRKRNIHWYQGVIDAQEFEGWEEGDDDNPEIPWCYSLRTYKINSAD